MRVARVVVLGVTLVSGAAPTACGTPRPRAPATPLVVALVKGGRALPAAPGPSREEIPVSEASSPATSSCSCAWPVFAHPDTAARAALATQVHHDLARFVDYRLGDDEVGNASLVCQVTAATRSLASFVCRSMAMSASKADWEQGMGGGAPAEETIESFVYLIDGAAVRRATFADVFANVSRAYDALPGLARAAVLAEDGVLAETCPNWKLPELHGEPPFTVSSEGLTLYFHHADFPTDEPACWQGQVGIGREALAVWVREDGVLGRVAGSDDR